MSCSLFFKWQLESFLLGEVSPGVQGVGGDETRWRAHRHQVGVQWCWPSPVTLPSSFFSSALKPTCLMSPMSSATRRFCSDMPKPHTRHVLTGGSLEATTVALRGVAGTPDSGGAGLCVFSTHLALRRCFLEPWSQCISVQDLPQAVALRHRAICSDWLRASTKQAPLGSAFCLQNAQEVTFSVLGQMVTKAPTPGNLPCSKGGRWKTDTRCLLVIPAEK